MFDNSSMNISASGLAANQLWLNVIANNIANVNTTRTPQGGPYRAEIVNFAPVGTNVTFQTALGQAVQGIGGGVQVTSITQDTSPFQLIYDPTNPDAVNGYVESSNVNLTTQMVDMIQATRAYQANATAFDAAKEMAVTALGIGK
ncbi:flagellar basal body rod protein FlgC [Alicyclobacillus mali]|uniref:Flagellar basal-body rod protein FlgC n=1 Tax=Alicyclobacillus mali (ex Roth et al. 2021) TaxID=1123961 RepID=A0ABS0F1R3_9BACL|nr:flagellar basal body rod protein FlgC [Alicyclobacillus mali (ex Roth et al. 2021)]MBF8377247.1 flagellar basal body rod protein FlgC [Alicyclobacillus mali (ex Roth et al. 2021)]MCL6488103.1 flagellar basal body rod protein FlgC [Alicyclobacillus mali (ex Roth et al. 2021)]